MVTTILQPGPAAAAYPAKILRILSRKNWLLTAVFACALATSWARMPARAIWLYGRPTKKQTINPASSIPTFSPSSMPTQDPEPMARS